MVNNRQFAEEIRDKMWDLFENNSYIEADEDDEVLFDTLEDIQTFKEASLCTNDTGMVLTFSDGSQAYITIQAYK